MFTSGYYLRSIFQMKYQSPKNQKSQRPPPPLPPSSFSVPPGLIYVIATPNLTQNNFPPFFLCTQGSLFCKPYLVKYSQSFLVFKKLNKFFCNILPLPKHTYNAVCSKNLSPTLKTYLSPRRSRSSLIPSNSVFKSRSFSCSTSTWLSY